MHKIKIVLRSIFFLLFSSNLLMIGCQQEETIAKITVAYNDSMYDLKQYKVERHPGVLRNGFGIDFFHEGNALKDTMYLASNTCSFEYDLLFYNEMAWFPLSNGDFSSSGSPVIFMYADSANASKSAKTTMVGQGIQCFTNFTADSIANYSARLRADAFFRITNFRKEVLAPNVSGKLLLQTTADSLYKTLEIGDKFCPNTGGVFAMTDVSDETQINYQPVFLIRTREGLYAKFMVTRYKGVGVDTQKLTLQWEAIKTPNP